MNNFSFAGFQFPRAVAALPSKPLATRLMEYKQRKPKTCGPYMAAPPVNAKGAFFYLESDFMPGLRWQWCDEVGDGFGPVIKHQGWFCDDFGDQVIRGLIMRLPGERGFLAGWSMGEGMASELDTGSIYADEISAAYAADSIAEYIAEREREYQENLRADLDETDTVEA